MEPNLPHLQVMSDMLPIGAVIAEAPSGRVLYGNAQAKRILRRDVSDANDMGQYAQSIWSHADGRRLVAPEFPLARAVCGESVDGVTLQMERGDGTVGWVRASAAPIRDANGAVVFALATIDDLASERDERGVLEQTLALQRTALQQCQLRTRSLLEHSPLDILVLQVDAAGRVTTEECSAAFCRTVGLLTADIVGRPIEAALGEAGAVLAAGCRTSLAQDGFEALHTLMFPAGERVLRSYYRPLPDEPPGARRVLLTQIDLTESRRMEGALRQAMRLEVIGQLTGGVAHEFNNLLTAVLGNLDLLNHRLGDERHLRWVQTAMSAARRGATLTHQLLAYARRQFMAPAATDIPETLGAMMELIRGSLGSRITLVTEFDPETWPALADPAQLELALLNLLTNARDAMPNGGRVLVSSRNGPSGQPGLPSELDHGDYVVLTVVDTGVGMPPDVLARAMEPFFTTKGIGEGSGLGLSQAYGVTRQLGGTLRLHSTPGEGTSAHIFLPRAVD